MPPQASAKSPVSKCFSSAVQGEWSETTQSISPARQPLPQGVAVGGVADRRAALELGGAVGDLLGGEAQVVRAGLDADPHAPGPGRADRGQRRRAGQVQHVHARAGPGGRPPAASRSPAARPLAGASAGSRRSRGRAGPAVISRASSACTISSPSNAAISRMRQLQPGLRPAAGTRPRRWAAGST